MMRKTKISALYNSFYKVFESIYNNTNNKDSVSLIKKVCDKQEIELIVGGLPKNVAGRTNGKSITVDFKDGSHGFNMFIFLHEYAHYYLHYDVAGFKLPLWKKELEADAFALLLCDLIYPGNYDALLTFARANPKIKRAA